MSTEAGERMAGPCVFDGCVATWEHYHGGFPGGYNDPADPEGVPIRFTGPDPDPAAVRDYNGAALRAATPAPPEPATKPPMDDDCPDFCSRWPSCGHTEADFNVPPLRAATPAPPEPGLHSLAHDAVSAWSHYFDGDRAGYWKPLCEAMDALAVETRKPAPSGPALDVERLYAAIRRIAMREGHPGHHDLRSGLTTPGLGHGYEITLAGAIAEEYTRGA